MRSTLLLLLATTLPACAHGAPPDAITGDDGGGTDDGGEGGTPQSYPDVQAFCAAYAQAECSQTAMTACGVQSGTNCASGGTAACLAAQPQGTTYVEANAPACIALAQKVYASATITQLQKQALAITCGTKVFSGPGQARTQCESDYDCSSQAGLSCVVPFGQTMGKCYVPTTVQPGDACADEAAVCTDGFYCNPMSKSCTVDAALGQSCSTDYTPCGDGLACMGAGPFASCAAKYADGHPCSADADCAGDMCDKASTQAQGTCASQITLSPLDSACTPLRGN